ncbi:fasciclin domain-containing protein [Bacteroidales bacterium OttesenSCG-928-L03]|nr:fasciclin domain-containing protein [Bacteroidales bacterium OttesenSCG-928-L03]
MKYIFQEKRHIGFRYLLCLFIATTLFVSCDRDYYYDKEEPEFMNGSIYEYLSNDGHFTYFTRLIDDLGYKEVLNLTGSKTLFVTRDESFDVFFQSNPWNVSSYDQLSNSQKKQIFYFSMINNAYTIGKLSNYYYGSFSEGYAMRRMTALQAIDSVAFDTELPQNSYWDAYRSKGMYLLKDDTDYALSYFSQEFMDKVGMTDNDFAFISGGKTREKGDFHVFNKKVIERDIVCKNGYVHILDEVLIPPVNMAEHIASTSNSTIFSTLLDRFCAPYYNASITALYRELHPGFTDSIFTKGYFANQGGWFIDPNDKVIPSSSLLAFSPGWNAYAIEYSNIYCDIASMFVPTDETMMDYFNNDPTGSLLKERYGTWDGLPDDVAVSFLKRHMRPSMVESLPSRFSKMVDDQNYPMGITESDIVKEQNYTAVNGEVFFTNKVYTPVDFISVFGPVLLSENSKIMNWAINRTQTATDGTVFAFYKLYLNSLAVKYGLFIPSDDYLDQCIDPVAYGQTGIQGAIKYWFNDETSTVNATLYSYSKSTHEVGDSVGIITDATFIRNRLWKMLDSHIVVGDISGDGYYVTKANDIIKVSNGGNTVQGGFDIDNNLTPNIIRKFDQDNGTTYMLDSPIQSSMRSVYSVLGDTLKEDFSLFFELLADVPTEFSSEIPTIFIQRGMDNGISFFNAYNYTIYVPTNEAIENAIHNRTIKTWEEINALPSAERKEETRNMVRFLRYHFQDRSVFLGQDASGIYESSTLRLSEDTNSSYYGTTVNRYYKIGVESKNGVLELTTESGAKAKVINREGYCNQIAKDYIFATASGSNSILSSGFKNVDGTGATTATAFGSSRPLTSSSAVIHLIDNVLTFK